MKKGRSIRETLKMIQTAVWLPRDMHEKLKKEGGKRGLGEEIRRRLKNSLKDEQPRDPETAKLLSAIKHIDGKFDEPWHAHDFDYDVFRAAMSVLIEHYPWGRPPEGSTSKLRDKYSEDAGTVGKFFALDAIDKIKKQSAEGQKG
jgi:hypothetical protein